MKMKLLTSSEVRGHGLWPVAFPPKSMSVLSLVLLSVTLYARPLAAYPVTADGQPAVLTVRAAGARSIRVTLRPESFKLEFPESPVLSERAYPNPALALRELKEPITASMAGLLVTVQSEPLRLTVKGQNGDLIQSLTFEADGGTSFALDEKPVLGMGEGGPKPAAGSDWRDAPVQFDRRGRFDEMVPRWQSDAYGSRNPVGLLVGTRGWALFFASPWGQFDLRQSDRGRFIPVTRGAMAARQNVANQAKQLGKGLPPLESFVPGLLDIFIFDARRPELFLKDLSAVSGAAVMPPKWSLGYMQSHRTLEDDQQMLRLVDTFREKRIPIDAVIYLGTGFTPRGWNTPQPSFRFNPEVFKRDPAEVIAELHKRNVKVALHMVPWDRDRLPSLQGSIPPQKGEPIDASHIADYWRQHVALVDAGVDAWWPDEGDWFDLYERMKRHQLYYQGPISTQPDRRPWSLHRNGYLGVARWGGWMWSGDTESSWKTLETQIAVGLDHSLSVGPYWGSDIGGFYSNHDLTGELYVRWFQFGAFCPLFRAHGRTWWMRLPWGWGLGKLGPIEDREPPLVAELNHPEIEPIARRYAELRYQLLSYNYTLAWQARETGLPFMRALWIHYPEDDRACRLGNEYLWGRDLLIAPVFQKAAAQRDLYLPPGVWYDWWSGETESGGRSINRAVDLATMPIYVRAGAIVPIDSIRQFTGEETAAPLTVRIYRGADGDYSLYEDDGESLGYLNGDAVLTRFQWNDRTSILKIQRDKLKENAAVHGVQSLRIEIVPTGRGRTISYRGEPMTIDFRKELE
jgi:alpha-glucosidase/alpha-D-xyloside xylohydrolase